jgi:hypothetical protein
MVNEKSKKTLPPYVSYRTFLNFLEGLRLGIPARIDRSYWSERYSGSTGVQLMTALRFLGLIDKDSAPTTRLRHLVSSNGTQRTHVLNQISTSAFDFILKKSLDPQVATYAQLEEAFSENYGVTGDVARKCIKFFVSLRSDAGSTISPFIMKRSRTKHTVSGRKRIAKADARTSRNSTEAIGTERNPAQLQWHEMVLARFPTLDPNWSDEVKLKWFEAFDTLLKRSPLW